MSKSIIREENTGHTVVSISYEVLEKLKEQAKKAKRSPPRQIEFLVEEHNKKLEVLDNE